MIGTWFRRTLVATATVAVSGALAGAQPVTYCTQFSFTPFGAAPACGGSVAQTFTQGAASVTLTLTGLAQSTVTAPSFINLGSVLAASSGTGFVTFSSTQVFMRVIQFSPTTGNATALGLITGAVDGTSSNGVINWNNPSRVLTIGPVTYEISPEGLGLTPINAPSTGVQTIRGGIVSSAVPEPSTVVLLASGIAGLGLFGLRARRRSASLV